MKLVRVENREPLTTAVAEHGVAKIGAMLLFAVGLVLAGCGDKKLSDEPLTIKNRSHLKNATSMEIDEELMSRERRNLLVFDGVIEKTSTVPPVQEMNYDDLISTLKVKVVTVLKGKFDDAKMVVQVPVVRNRTRLPASEFKVGDAIRFFAVPWQNVLEELQTIEQVDNVMDYNSPIFFALATLGPGRPSTVPSAALTSQRKQAIDESTVEIKRELSLYGKGSFEKWRQSLEPFYQEVKRRVSQLPQNPFGEHGLLVENSLAQEIVGTPSQIHPGVKQIIAFKQALQRAGIDFIYVSIPRPWMIYPNRITSIKPATKYVTPNYRQNLLSLLDADVEVVDTLPRLQEVAETAENTFYTPNSGDLHPTMEAMEVIANLVAQRLARYHFTSRQFEFFIQRPVPGRESVLQTVSADGVVYTDATASPLLVIGDSTIRVNHPAPAAGFSAILARELGIRPALMQRNGFCLADLAKASKSILPGRQVVVWVAWSLCLNRIGAPKCWETEIDWDKTRVFSSFTH